MSLKAAIAWISSTRLSWKLPLAALHGKRAEEAKIALNTSAAHQ